MHPETKAFLDMLAEQEAPSWQELGPTEARSVFAGLDPLFGDSPEVSDVSTIKVEDRFSIRVIRPQEEADLPVVMYFHGGGWVLGDAGTHTPLGRQLATQSGHTVVLVDYRLAPEHSYPAAMNDCYDATVYVRENAKDLGIDPTRLTVAGDSAGGNLAIAVALRARDEKGPEIRSQVLIYPVVEPSCQTRSYQEFAEGHGLTRASMQWFWQQYMGTQQVVMDPYLVPTQAESLEGLPPTHVITAEYDVLRDEGEHLADRLREAGVPTTHRRYDGVIHGFVHFNGAFEVGRAAVTDIAECLKSIGSS